MADLTRCPACGAPIEYAGNEDVVNCAFCGAQIKVTRNDGEESYQVLAQPEPQKDVLSQPVEPTPPEPNLFTGGAAQVYGAPSQPVPPPTYPAFNVPPAPAVGEVVNPANLPARSGGVTRWIIIGAVIIVGACLLLGCLAAVLLMQVRTQ